MVTGQALHARELTRFAAVKSKFPHEGGRREGSKQEGIIHPKPKMYQNQSAVQGLPGPLQGVSDMAITFQKASHPKWTMVINRKRSLYKE